MGEPPAVRDALAGDRAAAARTLAAAFQDDPVMAFFFPDPDVRRRRLPHVFAILFEGDRTHGAAFVTAGLEAATLWRAPGLGKLSLGETIAEAVPWMRAAGFALGRALAYSAASDANHPAVPHWYLHIAGCEPASQGRGFGRAVIAAGLSRADADGVAAYLETATEKNVTYYESFGFAVTHEWLVSGRLRNWSMLRPARP